MLDQTSFSAGPRRQSPASGRYFSKRVLVRGEPILASNGRADDFSWPRHGVDIDTGPLETLAVPPAPVPVQEKAVVAPRQGAQTASANPPVQRRSRTGDQLRLPFFFFEFIPLIVTSTPMGRVSASQSRQWV
jgi:hypothetical protein